MDESKRHAVQFLEKEIKTYKALALFLSKEEIKKHLRARDREAQRVVGGDDQRFGSGPQEQLMLTGDYTSDPGLPMKSAMLQQVSTYSRLAL